MFSKALVPLDGSSLVSLLRVVPLIPLISAHAVPPFGYASPAFNDLAIAELLL